jgi:serine/threonine protein kinase
MGPLERRMPSFEQQISWLGLMVEDTIVDRNMGSGPFSHLFRGCGLELPVNVVFKLAKDASEINNMESLKVNLTSSICTQALSFFTGGYYPILPDASFLLARQFEKLQKASCPGLVKVQHLASFGGMSYMRMEYLAGENFRATLVNRGARLTHFIELAGILNSLVQNDEIFFHGDLKPENIMHTGDGLRLIDCGYFGPMQCLDGEILEAAITTPIYYPTLKPDDLFAFGVMLFEAATGFHPLVGREKNAISPLRVYPLSDELREQLKLLSDLGFPDLESLASLPLVHHLAPHIRPEISQFLLAALRLQIGPDGLLTERVFFTDFAQLEAYMLKLQALGLDFV